MPKVKTHNPANWVVGLERRREDLNGIPTTLVNTGE